MTKIKQEELNFNIPKDKEDARRLLIDLEEQIGLPLRVENNKYIIVKYKPKRKSNVKTVTKYKREYVVLVEADYDLNWDYFESILSDWTKQRGGNGVIVKIKNTTK